MSALTDLTSKLDERSRQTEARVDNHQTQLDILTELARHADERLNTQLSWLNELGEAHANLDAKMAALTDAQIKTEGALANAQIRTEAALANLAGALANLAESHAKLAESQANLTESHAKLTESHAKLAESQAKLTHSQAKLADSQAHSDQRLDALIDIVRKRLNGEP